MGVKVSRSSEFVLNTTINTFLFTTEPNATKQAGPGRRRKEETEKLQDAIQRVASLGRA